MRRNDLTEIEHSKVSVRIERRIKILENGCWEWCGLIQKPTLTPVFPVSQGRVVYVRRFLVKLFRGHFPKRFFISPSCKTLNCVHPFHQLITKRPLNSTGGLGKFKKLNDETLVNLLNDVIFLKMPQHYAARKYDVSVNQIARYVKRFKKQATNEVMFSTQPSEVALAAFDLKSLQNDDED